MQELQQPFICPLTPLFCYNYFSQNHLTVLFSPQTYHNRTCLQSPNAFLVHPITSACQVRGDTQTVCLFVLLINLSSHLPNGLFVPLLVWFWSLLGWFSRSSRGRVLSVLPHLSLPLSGDAQDLLSHNLMDCGPRLLRPWKLKMCIIIFPSVIKSSFKKVWST